MKIIKPKKYTDFLWLKVGYCNWQYYKDRKLICYKGKHITFQWSQGLFEAVLLMQHSLDKELYKFL